MLYYYIMVQYTTCAGSNSCLNGGTLTNSTCTCLCPTVYTGTMCESEYVNGPKVLILFRLFEHELLDNTTYSHTGALPGTSTSIYYCLTNGKGDDHALCNVSSKAFLELLLVKSLAARYSSFTGSEWDHYFDGR